LHIIFIIQWNRGGKILGNPNARPELVFWFDRPPRAGAGAFRYIANNWGNTVFYLCVEPLSAERKSGGWQESDHGKAVVLFISEKKDPHSFVEKFVKDHEVSGAKHHHLLKCTF
jgi:hypothetical protein